MLVSSIYFPAAPSTDATHLLLLSLRHQPSLHTPNALIDRLSKHSHDALGLFASHAVVLELLDQELRVEMRDLGGGGGVKGAKWCGDDARGGDRACAQCWGLAVIDRERIARARDIPRASAAPARDVVG
jgi:hypothetical protein